MRNFLLSIVIPTKDRYKYLFPLVEYIDSLNFNDTEIVIEDNSSDNTDYLKYIGNHEFNISITYHYCKHQLPIKTNIDNAISHSNGKFVCVIGDDDAITPLLFDCIKWMDENGIDSVKQAGEYTYKWPTYIDEDKNFKSGTLLIPKVSNNETFVNAETAAQSVCKRGFTGLGNCPCVYQGIVRYDRLNELRSIGGTCFPGPSPDMANALSLSFIVKNHHIIKRPIIISGGSEYQGGKSKTVKSWVQPLSNVPFISDADKEAWDTRIPKFWIVETVWPESGIKGLSYVGKGKLLDSFNVEKNLAKCLLRATTYKNEILKCTDSKSVVYKYYILLLIRSFLSVIKRNIFSLLPIAVDGRKKITGIKTIFEAVDYLMNEEINLK